MPVQPPASRGRIPLHRSVRYVRFEARRFLGWVAVATVVTVVQLFFNRSMIRFYVGVVDGLLNLVRVPFERGVPEHLAFITIPSWSVETFNPVAPLSGAILYGCTGLFLALAVWRIPKIPFPVGSWISLLGILLLICTLVLAFAPVPIFTPEVFGALWLKVTVATSLIYPWFWVGLVGVLPLSVKRVGAWGVLTWVAFIFWNVFRLAFHLALARAAGVIWLPIAFILGCTLMDCLIFVIGFSRVLEPAGAEWQEPA